MKSRMKENQKCRTNRIQKMNIHNLVFNEFDVRCAHQCDSTVYNTVEMHNVQKLYASRQFIYI